MKAEKYCLDWPEIFGLLWSKSCIFVNVVQVGDSQMNINPPVIYFHASHCAIEWLVWEGLESSPSQSGVKGNCSSFRLTCFLKVLIQIKQQMTAGLSKYAKMTTRSLSWKYLLTKFLLLVFLHKGSNSLCNLRIKSNIYMLNSICYC